MTEPNAELWERFEKWAETADIPGVGKLSTRRMPQNPSLYSTRDTRIASAIWQAAQLTSAQLAEAARRIADEIYYDLGDGRVTQAEIERILTETIGGVK